MSGKSIFFNGGVEMPMLGVGTFQVKAKETKQAIRTALSVGYRLIDTALSYGNESGIGEALQEAFQSGIVTRKDVFITTKVPGAYLGSRDALRLAFEKSLSALQLDYIDLYLIHSPIGYKLTEAEDLFPRDTFGKLLYEHHDFIETWKAMEELVEEGLVKSLGVSNFNARQIERIRKVAKFPISNNQVECHVYFQQKHLAQFCKERDISLTAYGPLGCPGRIRASGSQLPVLLEDEQIGRIARKYSKSPAQVLLRFLTQKGIAVIPKSTNISRLEENFSIFDFELQEDDIEILEGLDTKRRFYDFLSIGEGHPEYPFSDAF